MGPKPPESRSDHDLFRTELVNLIDQHQASGSPGVVQVCSIAPSQAHAQNAKMKPNLNLRSTAAIIALTMLASTGFASPGPGDVPPPDLGHTFAGDEVRLTNFSGKAIVVTFWASWCPYCLKELPILEAVQNKAGKDQMAVIAVNTESSYVFRKVARGLRDKVHLELVSDASGAAQQAYGVHGIPHMLIIGRDGRILQVYRGYSEDSLDDIVANINQALLPTPGRSAERNPE